MPARLDIAGERYGRLVALRWVRDARGIVWICRCDCGSEVGVPTVRLRTGETRSCGCLKRELMRDQKLRHGMKDAPEYAVWSTMKARCHKPGAQNYGRYGARGIAVCARWRDSFETFIADMGRRPSPEHSIDRIDNDGNYEPGNCRWATRPEQMQNRRGWSRVSRLTIRGETLTEAEWARRLGTSQTTIHDRLRRGWAPERAVTEPVRRHNNPCMTQTKTSESERTP